MTDSGMAIDYDNLPAPTEGFLATLFITVRKVGSSFARDLSRRFSGAQVLLEENPCVVKLANSWILMNPGGPPTTSLTSPSSTTSRATPLRSS